jgi:hypothetical protein
LVEGTTTIVAPLEATGPQAELLDHEQRDGHHLDVEAADQLVHEADVDVRHVARQVVDARPEMRSVAGQPEDSLDEPALSEMLATGG